MWIACTAVYAAERCDYGPCEPEEEAADAACTKTIPSEVCEQYAASYGDCNGLSPAEIESAAQACQVQIAGGIYGYGDACGAAYTDLFACLSALNCRELEADDACADAWAAVPGSCVGSCDGS